MGSHCFSFFFQAEDGIRDVAVTGVQTCALPIWLDPGRVAPTDLVAGPIDRLDVSPGRVGVEGEAFDIGADGSERDLLDLSAGEGRRSEEHTSELQSRLHLVCRLLLEKKKNRILT